MLIIDSETYCTVQYETGGILILRKPAAVLLVHESEVAEHHHCR